jgi:hypothetical protein
MSSEEFARICVAKLCGWNSFVKPTTVGCGSGDGSCAIAQFLTADESDFHTAELMEATDQIRDILSKIPKRDGRKLGLLTTPFGVLLAWIQHDIEIPKGSITINSSDEEIIKALGLTNIEPEGRRTMSRRYEDKHSLHDKR